MTLRYEKLVEPLGSYKVDEATFVRIHKEKKLESDIISSELRSYTYASYLDTCMIASFFLMGVNVLYYYLFISADNRLIAFMVEALILFIATLSNVKRGPTNRKKLLEAKAKANKWFLKHKERILKRHNLYDEMLDKADKADSACSSSGTAQCLEEIIVVNDENP